MRSKKKRMEKDLGPFGTIVLGLMILFGPVYAFLGDFLWILLAVAATGAMLAGVNWIFSRYR